VYCDPERALCIPTLRNTPARNITAGCEKLDCTCMVRRIDFKSRGNCVNAGIVAALNNGLRAVRPRTKRKGIESAQMRAASASE
jgi:hypothetical protein